MYRWERPPLLVPRLIQTYGVLNNFVLLYLLLPLLQYNWLVGPPQLISPYPLGDDEQQWLVGNLMVLVGQLSLLAGMWTVFQARPWVKMVQIQIVDVMPLLPRWGLFRGLHSIYSFCISRRNFVARLGILTALAPAWFLLRSCHVQILRLVPVVHALIYIDAWSCFFELGYQSTPELVPDIIANIKSTPYGEIAALMYLAGHLPLIFVRYRYLILAMPALSTALLMRYLLIPWAPGPPVEPLPLPSSPMRPERSFCEVCEKTVLAGLKKKEPRINMADYNPHQPTLQSLRRSAMEGCRICLTVWGKMSAVQSEWGPLFSIPMVRATTWQNVGNNSVMMNCKWKNRLCEFGIIEAKGRGFKPKPTNSLEDHTGSNHSLDMAKGWLSKCLLNHSACNLNRGTGFRPSRLLYLGDDRSVRLHTSRDYPENLSYMTLSHCWGDAHFIQLQQGNRTMFEVDIPWDSLPQTFKDAIRVARHLGSKYIWIDSLCILQDSEEDWVKESRMMGNVYQSSTCNIAASDAANSREGCLYPRNHRAILPESLPWRSETDSQQLYLANKRGIVKQVHQLYSRAWVLQEAILARRTLDCARDQLFWRCDECVTSEEFPEGLEIWDFYQMIHPSHSLVGTLNDVSSLGKMVRMMEKWKTENKKVLDMPGPRGQNEEYLQTQYDRQSPGGFWSSIVEIYSRMSITRPTDRPVAIAGLADGFRPFLGEYYAGMWQHLLPGHLAWSIREFSDMHYETSPCHRSLTKRAPSWSWLSLEGRIYYRQMTEYHPRYETEDGIQRQGDKCMAHLLGVDVISDEDIRLQLRAPLARATWIEEPKSSLSPALAAIGVRSVTPGVPTVVGQDGVSRWRVPLGIQSSIEPERPITLFFDVAEEAKTARDVVLVAIRTYFSMVEGLVLQYEDGVHLRVGRFTAWESAGQCLRGWDHEEFVLA